MAQRRMFSLQIVDTDAFLDMPISSQLLYFHLVMRADDEGFIDNPKKIMRLIGTQEDDFKVLLAKRFILLFKSGVIVVKHWLIHNTIRMDRFKETVYTDEKNLLKVKENRVYTENGNQMATIVQPLGNPSKDKLSKDKLSKVKLEEFIYIGNKTFLEAYEGFLEMRKAKKKLPTERAERMILKKLHEYTQEEATTMLDNSTKNNWSDVYEPKNKPVIIQA